MQLGLGVCCEAKVRRGKVGRGERGRRGLCAWWVGGWLAMGLRKWVCLQLGFGTGSSRGEAVLGAGSGRSWGEVGVEGQVEGTGRAKGGRCWCGPHPHTLEAPGEDRLLPSKGAFGLGGHHIRLWAAPLVQWSAQRGSWVPLK